MGFFVRRCVGSVLLAAALVGLAASSEPAPAPVGRFDWDSDLGFQLRAALAVTGAGGAWNAVAARVAISENAPAVEGWGFAFDRALPLDRRFLNVIRDRRELPDRNVGPFIRDMPVPDQGFYRAFLEALRRSRWATGEMMENSGTANSAVTHANLAAVPARYRGEVINVKGKITLIRRNNPPLEFTLEDRIPDIYYTFIITDTPKAPPFVAVFSELPKELTVSENLFRGVSFDGYFLGLVKFPASKDPTLTKDLICPYLVGKTLIVQPAPKREEVSYSAGLILWSLGGIVAIVFFGAGLMLWFRRGDQRVQSELQAVRDKHQPFNLEPDSPPPSEPPP
jgi:hypothetical protein